MVERYRILKDAEEMYALDVAATTSPDELQQLMDSFASFRQKRRRH
jgi:hypothetical protein